VPTYEADLWPHRFRGLLATTFLSISAYDRRQRRQRPIVDPSDLASECQVGVGRSSMHQSHAARRFSPLLRHHPPRSKIAGLSSPAFISYVAA
jgi:hypothetical protein